MFNSTKARKSGKDETLSKDEFITRFMNKFYDPTFKTVSEELKKICEIAWQNYSDSHKAPLTQKAGEDFLILIMI